MMMPLKRFSQRLSRSGDEALPQTTTQNEPPIQNLPDITEGLGHTAFTDTEEVELQHATNNNASTTPTGSRKNTGGTGSTQTNGGILHQSPPRASSPIQIIQEHAKLKQLQVEDWEEEFSEDEAIEEAELARVQQEIERLHQEKEAITRRQAAAQRAKVKR
jgi:hypothetical protein